MTENETLIRGIAIGVSTVLPVLGLTLGKWHSWKGWSKFWQMMHKDLQIQNERLFTPLKTQTALVLKLKRDRNWESSHHHKYKRCLSMAKWCDAKADWYYSIGESFRNRVEFYMKWNKRWLELAEKFKG